MPIRDNEEARELLKKLNVEDLRKDIDQWLAAGLAGRSERDLSGKEMEEIFLKASPMIQAKYGVDIWDAMMLLNVAGPSETASSSFDEWRHLYDTLFDMVRELNIDAHLQDDFDGRQRFDVWCSTEDYQRLIARIEQDLPVTSQPFEVVVMEVLNSEATGREQIFRIGVNHVNSSLKS